MIQSDKKHISVPIREWTNNHYSFNKNLEKHSFPYLNNVNKITKNYFNLTPKEMSFKSKRMRDLIKKSSTTRIFNSKGEIKQYGDKVNITIYTFDKEKIYLLKNLYSFNKFINKYKKLNKVTFKKLYKINNIDKLKNIVINKYPLANNSSNQLSLPFNLTNIKSKRYFKLTKAANSRYWNIFDKNMNYYYKKFKPTFNKKNIILKANKGVKLRRKSFFKKKRLMLQSKKNLLYKKLINYLPWSYNSNRGLLTKITIMRLFYLFILRNSNLTYYLNKEENCIYINKSKNLSQEGLNNNKCLKIKLPAKYNLIQNINKKRNKPSKRINYLKWERIIYINKILNKVVTKILNKLNESNDHKESGKKINLLYKEFINNNMFKLLKHYYQKQQQIINNIYKPFITNDKLTNLTNNLKFLLNKIYSKKVNLNITNLKYSHLNADIFTNVLVTKLIRRKSNIKRIITKGFKLVRLAKINKWPVKNKADYKNKINLLNLINGMYTSINNVTLKTKKSNYEHNYNSKIIETIKNLKHKWTTGIKIEGKGRLTTRYAAARAIHKYSIKGNLRSKLPLNNQNLLKLGRKRKITDLSPSNILFRGIYGPNIQYVKKSGFKRIGSFGVKVWINNN